MKRNLLVLTAILMTAILLAGCGSSTEAPGTGSEALTIGIIQPMDHPSLNTIRETIISHLEEIMPEGSINIIYKNAQGDTGNINTIVSQFIGDQVDILVPIGTGPAQAIAAATDSIPVVFAAVSYPVEAGIVPSLDYTEGNITGVSNAIAIEDIVALAQTLTPEATHFGIIYNSGEDNSVVGVNRAKAYMDANGLTYTEATIASSADLLQATQSLIGKVDAIFTPNDNTVATAMPTLAAEAIKAKLPVYVGADSLVEDGGLATVGIDYVVLGEQVGDMIKRIADGQTIAQNPIEVINEYAKMINTTTAEEIGLTLPDSVLNEYKLIQ